MTSLSEGKIWQPAASENASKDVVASEGSSSQALAALPSCTSATLASKVCVCGLRGHCLTECPLVLAMQFGSEADIKQAEMEVARNAVAQWLTQASLSKRPCFKLSGGSQCIRVNADGHCLFTSFALGWFAARGGDVTKYAAKDQTRIGMNARRSFLSWVRPMLEENKSAWEWNVRRLLLDDSRETTSEDVAEYISKMTITTPDAMVPQRAWAGIPELFLMSQKKNVNVAVLRQFPEGSVQLWCRVGPATGRCMYLLWVGGGSPAEPGTHYELALLAPADEEIVRSCST